MSSKRYTQEFRAEAIRQQTRTAKNAGILT